MAKRNLTSLISNLEKFIINTAEGSATSDYDNTDFELLDVYKFITNDYVNFDEAINSDELLKFKITEAPKLTLEELDLISKELKIIQKKYPSEADVCFDYMQSVLSIYIFILIQQLIVDLKKKDKINKIINITLCVFAMLCIAVDVIYTIFIKR